MVNIWRNPAGWLCAIALFLLSGCGSNSATPPVRELRQLELTVVASDRVNPDSQGQATPIEIRIYELKNDAAFTTADYWSLQDKDKAVLAEDLLHRDSFILRPGEVKTLRRSLDAQTTALGIIAGYRVLGKSVWRETYKTPEAPESSWYSRVMPDKEIRLVAGMEPDAIVITERDK